MQNHFVFFQIPQCFAVDLIALEKSYHAIQNRIHPDKFTQTTDIEKHIAIQRATSTNQAYQILKHPLKRAIHLCELNNVILKNVSTMMSSNFLTQQMNWHEAIDKAKISQNFLALEQLKNELCNIRENIFNKIETLLNENNFIVTLEKVKKLMFLEKLINEIDHILYEV